MKKTQQQLNAQRLARRAVPGRRAGVVQGGPMQGVFIPVKKEVPSTSTGAVVKRPCALCPNTTKREPDPSGKVVCSDCRPLPKEVPPLRVGRLCVRCDRQLIKKPEEVGPFLCHRCNLFLTTGRYTTPKPLQPSRPDDILKARSRRVAELRLHYETATARIKEHGGEAAARKVGVKTELADFPAMEFIGHDDPNASPVGDGSEGEEDNAS